MLEGYRGWKVRMIRGQPTLVSPSHVNRVWLPGENIACCEQCEDGPSEDCSCGFYSLKSPSQELVSYNSDIIGVVQVWGRMEEGELGYRSKYAQVSMLLLPSIEPLSEMQLKWLCFRYGVLAVKAEGPIAKAIEVKRRERLIQRGKLPVLAAINQYRRDYAWKNKREYIPDYKTHNTRLE